MLAADKMLLDAHLRNELQQLRRIEVTNVVNRFQTALTPATLIAGFSFESIVKLQFTVDHIDASSGAQQHAEPIFYLCSSFALSLSLYVTAVASVGILLGQRITVQATALQGADHDATVRELNSKFFWVLLSLGVSMIAVAVAATAVIFVKDPSGTVMDGVNLGYSSWTALIIGSLLGLWTCYSMVQMFLRLHTPAPAASTLDLRAGKGQQQVGDASEFFIAGGHTPSSFKFGLAE